MIDEGAHMRDPRLDRVVPRIVDLAETRLVDRV
jgi:hypothetical protein